MFTEFEVLEHAVSLSREIENKLMTGIEEREKSEKWKKLSNYSKRLNNMISSDGFSKAILFAFSKAKINKTMDFYNKLFKNVDSDAKLEGEGDYWAVILASLVKFVFNDEYDLLSILQVLYTDKVKSDEWKREASKLLERMARIFEAYA